MFFQEVQELGVLWVVASLPMGGTQSVAVLGTKLSASREGGQDLAARTCPGLPVAAGLQPGLGLVQPRGLPRLARHRGSDGLGTPGWQCHLCCENEPRALQLRAGCVLGASTSTHQRGFGKNSAPKTLSSLL